jgi:threonine/homoserine/homoserine lactone efflux protein
MAAASGLRMLAQAWLVTTLNLKGLLFFVTFFPQFVDANATILSREHAVLALYSVLCQHSMERSQACQ